MASLVSVGFPASAEYQVILELPAILGIPERAGPQGLAELLDQVVRQAFPVIPAQVVHLVNLDIVAHLVSQDSLARPDIQGSVERLASVAIREQVVLLDFPERVASPESVVFQVRAAHPVSLAHQASAAVLDSLAKAGHRDRAAHLVGLEYLEHQVSPAIAAFPEYLVPAGFQELLAIAV